ncbi:MAG: hypothetical protein ACREEM_09530 [Blastocatellia bacterium]
MKRVLIGGLRAAALCCALVTCAWAQVKTTDFTGTWVLDKVKTQNLPATLESYTLNVEQDEQRMALDARLEGELNMPGGGRGGMGGGMPRGRRGGGGFPGGGGGFPGGGGGGFPGGGGMGGPGGGGMGGPGGMPGGMSIPKEMVMTMALQMGVRRATFPLNGEMTVIPMEEGREPEGNAARPSGTASVRGEWKKGGKQLELTAIHKINLQGEERVISSKDRWEITKEGQLLVRRSVELPMGSEEVKLLFNKQP